MIQRIQSIWLLLAAVAAFLTLGFPFYSGNLVDAATNIKAHSELTARSTILLTILNVAAGLGALAAIFLYKDRKKQFKVVLGVLLVSVINIVLFFLESKKFVANESNFTLTAAFAFAVPVFLILAARGIRADEKLVKSLDRLR